MRWTPIAVALLALGGCGKDENETTDGTFVPPTTNTTCPDTALCDSGPVAPAYMEPVAVGFDLDAVLYEDGTLHPVQYEDGSESPTFLKLTFADQEFFGLAAEQQLGHYCEVGIVFEPTPQDQTNPAFNTKTGAPLYWSYETNLNMTEIWEFIDPDTGASTSCVGMVDPDVWGTYAENLIGPFNGAHVGIGFAPMTDYLWDAFGGTTATANADYLDKFIAMYVAVNDKDGGWGGCDWTSALLFEVDPVTDVAVADTDGFLIPQVTSDAGLTGLPKGYVRTFAYWYQDFPLMDFANLANDPVSESSWICDQ